MTCSITRCSCSFDENVTVVALSISSFQLCQYFHPVAAVPVHHLHVPACYSKQPPKYKNGITSPISYQLYSPNSSNHI